MFIYFMPRSAEAQFLGLRTEHDKVCLCEASGIVWRLTVLQVRPYANLGALVVFLLACSDCRTIFDAHICRDINLRQRPCHELTRVMQSMVVHGNSRKILIWDLRQC